MQSEFDRDLRNRAWSPLNFAAYITWLGVTASSISWPALADGALRQWGGLAALLGMIALSVLLVSQRMGAYRNRRQAIAAVIAQGLLVLVAAHLLRDGAVPVLLIIVAAQLFTMLAVSASVLIMIGLNLGLLVDFHARDADLHDLLVSLLPLIGFQAFAAMTALYAERSERRGDALVDLNAALRATQRLLEESTRSDERLRLSRDLHDVAGHKLTALKLQLRALHRDRALAGNPTVEASLKLADELLADIRAVVGELRRHDGVALGEALRALVAPLPGVRIELIGADDARAATVAQAQALLRVAQEGLTNAIRHGRAGHIVLRVEESATGLLLAVEDDGAGILPLSEGNGLRGMRERLAELGGELRLDARPPRGLALRARLPVGMPP